MAKNLDARTISEMAKLNSLLAEKEKSINDVKRDIEQYRNFLLFLNSEAQHLDPDKEVDRRSDVYNITLVLCGRIRLLRMLQDKAQALRERMAQIVSELDI